MAKNYSNTSKNSQNGFYSSKEENQSKNRNSTSNSGSNRIPVKILIQIRVRTAQTAILKMQMTAMAEKMIMMSQTDINRYCEQ